MTIVLSFISLIVPCMEEREHAWNRIDLHRDQWKDGRKGLDASIIVLYILLSLSSVSWMDVGN